MQKNVGSADVFIRTLIGISFLVNIIILEPSIGGGIFLFLLGAIFLATAWFAYCPLYTALNTCTCQCEASCCETKAE